MDLKEAGSVVKPSHRGANVVEGPSQTVLAREKREDDYVLYEEEEEEEEIGGANNKEGTVNRNALSPTRIRCKLTAVAFFFDK